MNVDALGFGQLEQVIPDVLDMALRVRAQDQDFRTRVLSLSSGTFHTQYRQ